MTGLMYQGGGEPDLSLSRRQEQIVRWLADIGPGVAMFFQEACGLMLEDPPRATVTHLVSHLLRDVESAVRDVLAPTATAARGQVDGHRAEVTVVLETLNINLDDPNAEFWLGLTGRGNTLGLASRAHRFGLAAPRAVGDEFRSFFDQMERLLATVLERFEARYRDVFDRLDALLGTATPNAADAEQLRQKFPHTYATSRYFFTRASSAWLRPLLREGFFRLPPQLVVNDDGAVSLPDWPESAYLARVAAQDPDAAVEAALGIPATDDSRVGHNLVEVALAVPPDHSARLTPRIISALNARFGVLIPQRVGDLCVHLAQGGYPDDALTLAGRLLRDVPSRYGPASTVDAYEYAMTLRTTMPALASKVGMPVLAMLAELLDKAVAADASRRTGGRYSDMSVLWRPQIDGHELRGESDPRHALVNAVRDVAVHLVDTGSGNVTAVVGELQAYRWPLFRRLALYLLTLHGQDAPELVGAHLTDPAMVGDYEVEREFLLLAAAGCSWVSSRDQQRLLTLIHAGPDTSAWEARYKANTGHQPPRPLVQEWIGRWQRDRLAAARAILPPSAMRRYQALVAEYGEAPDPAATIPEPSAVFGDESPVPVDDLMALPTAALVEFLRSWQPPAPRRPQHDAASLRGALASAVQRDAGPRSSDAASFVGLPAEYVTAVIDGLLQAAEAKVELDWPPVLRLCAWADQQACDELAQPTATAQNRVWRRARVGLLGLLIRGMNVQPDPIPALADDVTVWSVIEAACSDPDPGFDDEARTSGDDRLHGLALRTVRPRAIHAAITYARRVRRREPTASLDRVLAVLSDHLDPQADPSGAIRATYGDLFAFLTSLDVAWAKDHVAAIFPTDPSRRLLRDTAWDAYLRRRAVTDETWTLLTEQYRHAVERLDPTAQDEWSLAQASDLGFHLGSRYWFGQLRLDDHDGLLRRFYDRAPSQVRAEVLESMGRSLLQEDIQGNEPDPDRLQRLRELWAFRVHAVRHGADPRELAEFGHWFASAAFDDEWALQQLLITLRLAADVAVEVRVLGRLAALAATRPQTCLTILDAWLRTEPKPWHLSRCLDSIRSIVAAGLGGDAAAAETSQVIVSWLLRRGIDLREVSPTASHTVV